jgi:hypothetical protein
MIGAVTKKLIVFGLKIQFFKKQIHIRDKSLKNYFPSKAKLVYLANNLGI